MLNKSRAVFQPETEKRRCPAAMRPLRAAAAEHQNLAKFWMIESLQEHINSEAGPGCSKARLQRDARGRLRRLWRKEKMRSRVQSQTRKHQHRRRRILWFELTSLCSSHIQRRLQCLRVPRGRMTGAGAPLQRRGPRSSCAAVQQCQRARQRQGEAQRAGIVQLASR
jgi:hypothetical protein